ncbi:hypothetical protein [Rhodococcus koreensis]|uniref:hypothetical protein n=1 Tax=Rhodococcus koreensis TaxID=99653 RepID=UPI00366BF0D3
MEHGTGDPTDLQSDTETGARDSHRNKMWNRYSDNDVLDFALLWEPPPGGPASENVAAAFAIDINEYKRRLTAAVGFPVSPFRQVVTPREFIDLLSDYCA